MSNPFLSLLNETKTFPAITAHMNFWHLCTVETEVFLVRKANSFFLRISKAPVYYRLSLIIPIGSLKKFAIWVSNRAYRRITTKNFCCFVTKEYNQICCCRKNVSQSTISARLKSALSFKHGRIFHQKPPCIKIGNRTSGPPAMY